MHPRREHGRTPRTSKSKFINEAELLFNFFDLLIRLPVLLILKIM